MNNQPNYPRKIKHSSKIKRGGEEMRDKKSIQSFRNATDGMIDKIDDQAIKNFETNLELNNLRMELQHNLQRLDQHTYCPSQVHINCDSSKGIFEMKQSQISEPSKEHIHGEDCHCSKCCPNPNPNFFQRNKVTILMSILWCSLLVLAVGWSPSGETFDAIQTSYVDLLVNFFKMAILGVASIVTYQLIKKNSK